MVNLYCFGGKDPHIQGDNTNFVSMEKEQVIENLRQRVGENDFSDRSMDEFVTPLLSMFADDAKITEETWTPLVTILKTSNGQNRHNVAEGIKAGLAEKETLINEKEAKIAELMKQIEDLKKTPTPPPVEPKPDKGISAEVQAILDQMKKDREADNATIKNLQETINGFQKSQEERETATKLAEAKANLLSFLKESKATNEAVMNLAISDIEIKADSKIADLQTLVKAAYEKRFKEFYPNGGAPFGGNGQNGGGGNGSESEVAAYIKAKAEAAKANAQYAETLQGSFK